MAKILLVEDDQNLREIFAMRLQAEGYQTVTAGDGEEALTVAVREKPDLIIADVMMPKLSGFEMLETLRAAPDMADTKVVMMTALGQAEDQARGEKLGVVKYLVKSQVTLEDFVRVVHDVLQPGEPNGPKQDASSNNNKESEKPMDDPTTPTPSNPTPVPDAPAPGGDAPMVPDVPQQSAADEQGAVDSQVNDFASSTPAAPSPAPGGDSPLGGSVPVTPAPADDPASPPASGGDGSSAPTDSTSSGL